MGEWEIVDRATSEINEINPPNNSPKQNGLLTNLLESRFGYPGARPGILGAASTWHYKQPPNPRTGPPPLSVPVDQQGWLSRVPTYCRTKQDRLTRVIPETPTACSLTGPQQQVPTLCWHLVAKIARAFEFSGEA